MNDSWKKKLSDLTRTVGQKVKSQNLKVSGEKLTHFMKSISSKIPKSKGGKGFDLSQLKDVKKHLSLSQLKNLKIDKNISSGKLAQLPDLILSPEFRTHWHRLFLVSSLGLLTWNAGKIPALMLGTFFEKKVDTDQAPAIVINRLMPTDFDLIKQSDLFNASGSAAIIQDTGPKIDIAKIKCDDAESRSTLPIKLVNTVVLQDQVKSVASVQVRTSLQEVRIGDEIDGMAKVEKIRRLQMVVKNLRNGACESIDNGEAEIPGAPIQLMNKTQKTAWKGELKKMKGIENNGNSFTINKALINDQMADIGTILTQAKGTPVQNPDGTMSFVISDVVAGGLFSYLGIQDGDVITSINGKKITDLNEVMNLFGTIKMLDNLQLTIDRGGMSSQLDYQFK